MPAPIVRKKADVCSVSPVFNPSDPIHVVGIGWHKTPPVHTFGPAVRPCYLLHLIKSGKGEIERAGKVTRLGTGDAFLIRPREVTTYRADKDEPWEYYWILFNGDFAEELVRRTTDKLCMPHRKSGLLALQTAVENEIGHTVDLLNTLFKVLDSIQTNTEKTMTSDEIDTAIHYLENNYFREIDVATLAAQFGFSRTYFSTLFLKRTGESPYRYLTNIRLKKAEEYLRENVQTIEEIAFSVGFSCIGRFSELFKKYTGVSPLQYRKNFLACH